MLYCTLSIGILKNATFGEHIRRVSGLLSRSFPHDFRAQGVTLKSKAMATKCIFQIYSQLLDICTRLVLKTAEELFVPRVLTCSFFNGTHAANDTYVMIKLQFWFLEATVSSNIINLLPIFIQVVLGIVSKCTYFTFYYTSSIHDNYAWVKRSGPKFISYSSN